MNVKIVDLEPCESGWSWQVKFRNTISMAYMTLHEYKGLCVYDPEYPETSWGRLEYSDQFELSKDYHKAIDYLNNYYKKESFICCLVNTDDIHDVIVKSIKNDIKFDGLQVQATGINYYQSLDIKRPQFTEFNGMIVYLEIRGKDNENK